ncbi:MAG: VOC family protein, partial [Flavobacteriales bacterium]|nr:VOC family protein [Flavobacteriales bacterium]
FLLGLNASLTDPKNVKSDIEKMEELRVENDGLKNILIENKNNMKKQMIRSLTFQDGNAEEAMNFYVEVFKNSKVISVKHWGEGMPNSADKIMQATFELDGNLFMCSDSPAIHDWNFTPAVANYVECDDENEINELYSKLSENGKIMMELANHGFSQKFAFIEDQYRVSWQLNLE